MASYDCSAHRNEAPARLAGELSSLAQARFDAHQRTCEECRAFTLDLSRALAAARAEPPPLSVEERDQGYAALVDRLRSEPRTEAPAVRPRRLRTRWILAGAIAAAAALVLVLLPSSRRETPGATAAPLVAASPRAGLDVRATSGSQWTLEESETGTTLVLATGTLHVRLAPLPPGRSLFVRTPDLRVRVVGTIFSVHSEPGRPSEVAVMRGTVVVETPGAPPTTLVAGEAQRGAEQPGALRSAEYDPVRDWLAAPESPPARPEPMQIAPAPLPAPPRSGRPITRAAPPPGPTSPPARAPAPDGPTYADAERVLAEQGPAAAAALLERILTTAPDGPDADTARLELGRLYAGPVRRPDDARRHLQTFLGRNPTGPGVATATALLCRLDPRDPLCGAER